MPPILPLRSRWRPLPPALVVIVFCAAALVTGCSSVDHIRALRDAQDDFSKAAQAENEQSFRSLFPDKQRLDDLVAGKDEARQPAFAETAFRQYVDVAQRLGALESASAAQLKQDGLYAQTIALRTFAEWRANYHANVLRVANGQPPASRPAGGDPAAATRPAWEPEALTGIAARAMAITGNTDLSAQLYPRDQFLLQHLPSLIDYDTALVRYLQANRLTGAGKASEIVAAVTTMARADQALAQSRPEGPSRDFTTYWWMARLTMLTTARKVLAANDDANNPALRVAKSTLNAQVAAFRDDLANEDKGAPFRRLLIQQNVTTEADFNTWASEKFAPL